DALESRFDWVRRGIRQRNWGMSRNAPLGGPLGNMGRPSGRRHPGDDPFATPAQPAWQPQHAGEQTGYGPNHGYYPQGAAEGDPNYGAPPASGQAPPYAGYAPFAQAAQPPPWGQGQQPDPRGYDLGTYMPAGGHAYAPAEGQPPGDGHFAMATHG